MEDAKNKAKGAAVNTKRAKGRKTAVKRRTKTRKLPRTTSSCSTTTTTLMNM